MRTIRVICSDPYATDDSSDEEMGPKPVKRVVREIRLEDPVPPKPAKGKKRVGQTGSNPYPGVRKRKWGRWSTEIRDPFRKSRLWLGTFDTAKEAHVAYQEKKREFTERKIFNSGRFAASSPLSVLENDGGTTGSETSG